MYDQAVEVFFQNGEFAEFGAEAEAALKRTYETSGWRAFWQRVLNLLQDRIKRTKRDRPLILADVYMRLGENNKALTELEKASAHRSWTITTLNVEPLFDNLRPDPRYSNLVRGMGLEP